MKKETTKSIRKVNCGYTERQGTGERRYREVQITSTALGLNLLSENGALVVLNNGIEFIANALMRLLILFFFGTGRYLTIDHRRDCVSCQPSRRTCHAD